MTRQKQPIDERLKLGGNPGHVNSSLKPIAKPVLESAPESEVTALVGTPKHDPAGAYPYLGRISPTWLALYPKDGLGAYPGMLSKGKPS